MRTTTDDLFRQAIAALALVAVAAVAGCGGDGDEAASVEEPGAAETAFGERVAPAIEAALGEPAGEGEEGGAGAIDEAVAAAYAERGHRPLWLGPDGPTARGKELAVALLEARRHGLDAADYEGESLAMAVAELTRREARADEEAYAARVAELEPQLSASFLTLARHLASGRLAPSEAGIHWESEPRQIDLAKVIQVALDEGPQRALAGARPPHEQYAALEKALARYREIVAGGGWPVVADGEALEPGDEDAQRVPVLRRRLAAEGYATGAAAAGSRPARAEGDAKQEGEANQEGGAAAESVSPLYDETLASAVREYQRRRSLTPDGVVGGKTLEELNVPAVERVRQIEANLERWRWMPADLGDRYVLVNVPRFELHAVEGGEEVMRMRVVVGEELNATPMFSDRMQYVVFNPYWNIPHTIAGEEVIPALRRDRSYLARNEMEVVRGWENGQVLGSWVSPSVAAQAADESSGIRIRQRPGKENPLGQIKFLFPNEHAIYLHDTSAGHLFDETIRLFSHGCIRIEKPVELASWALGKPPEEIRAKMQSGASDEWTSLPREIPVHILYYTVAVDDDGTVLFFDDFYGIDGQVLAALDGQGAAA